MTFEMGVHPQKSTLRIFRRAAAIWLVLALNSIIGCTGGTTKDLPNAITSDHIISHIKIGMSQADVDSIAMSGEWTLVTGSDSSESIYYKETGGETWEHRVLFVNGAVDVVLSLFQSARSDADAYRSHYLGLVNAFADGAESIWFADDVYVIARRATRGRAVVMTWRLVNDFEIHVESLVTPERSGHGYEIAEYIPPAVTEERLDSIARVMREERRARKDPSMLVPGKHIYDGIDAGMLVASLDSLATLVGWRAETRTTNEIVYVAKRLQADITHRVRIDAGRVIGLHSTMDYAKEDIGTVDLLYEMQTDHFAIGADSVNVADGRTTFYRRTEDGRQIVLTISRPGPTPFVIDAHAIVR